MRKILTALLALALLSPTVASAKVHRLSTAKEFKKIEPDLQPGDTVLWASGTFNDVSIRLRQKGTAEAPIVLRAEVPGGTSFTGRSNIGCSGEWLVLEGFRFDLPEHGPFTRVVFSEQSSHCRISDCLFTDETPGWYIEKSSYTVGLNGRNHVVSHCSFLDKKSVGVIVSVKVDTLAPVSHIIEYNYFERPTVLRRNVSILDEDECNRTGFKDILAVMNAQECIRIGYSGHSLFDCNCTVRGNWFNRCCGEYNEIISNKSCGNVYEGNLFTKSPGTLTLRHGNNCIVRGNYFLGEDDPYCGGVRVIGEGHLVENNWFEGLDGEKHRSAFSIVCGKEGSALGEYLPSDNCTVRGNTFLNCRETMNLGLTGYMMRGDSYPKNLRITDNTIICSTPGQISVINPRTDGEPAVWKSNRIFGGIQQGCSYPEVRRKPKVTDSSVRESVTSIKKAAGVTW